MCKLVLKCLNYVCPKSVCVSGIGPQMFEVCVSQSLNESFYTLVCSHILQNICEKLVGTGGGGGGE